MFTYPHPRNPKISWGARSVSLASPDLPAPRPPNEESVISDTAMHWSLWTSHPFRGPGRYHQWVPSTTQLNTHSLSASTHAGANTGGALAAIAIGIAITVFAFDPLVIQTEPTKSRVDGRLPIPQFSDD